MRNLNWNDFNFSIERQVHLLRHFCTIDEQYHSMLINQQHFKREAIDNLINSSGSKFFFSIASNLIEYFNWLLANSPEIPSEFSIDICKKVSMHVIKHLLKGLE